MAKTSSLLAKLKTDFPEVTFEPSDDFYWSPTARVVYYDPSDLGQEATLMHELAHALLAHRQFRRDIDLVKIEREAWEYARSTLAPRYDVSIDDDTVEAMIDTYRDWLHARSTCPACRLTGVQRDDRQYHCVGCGTDWRVNDARRCGLKRYTLTT